MSDLTNGWGLARALGAREVICTRKVRFPKTSKEAFAKIMAALAKSTVRQEPLLERLASLVSDSSN